MALCFSITFCWFCLFLFSLTSTMNEIFITYPILMVAKLLMNIYVNSICIGTIWKSVQLTEEAVAAKKLLYKFLNISEDRRLNERLTHFINQISHNQQDLVLSCGLVTFDWKLCFKVRVKILFILLLIVLFPSSLAGLLCT